MTHGHTPGVSAVDDQLLTSRRLSGNCSICPLQLKLMTGPLKDRYVIFHLAIRQQPGV